MASQHYTLITWLRGWHNAPRLLCHLGADILVQYVAREDMWYMLCDIFKSKQSQIRWNTRLVDTLFQFKIRLLCLLRLATASLDLQPDLISMQNKYTRGWYNCLLSDITVIGGWYHCFRRDFAFFRVTVDCYFYRICNITWKLIKK